MTHRLLLVRHAQAAAPTAGLGLLRPLSPNGERQALELGRRLREGDPLGPVLCSPATRCLQTAQGILVGLGRGDEPVICSDLVEDAPRRLSAAVAERAEPGSVLVSHQPVLVDLACHLLAMSVLPFALPPAAAILLGRTDTGPWSVQDVLAPS